MPSAEDAKDVSQNVLIKIYNNLSNFKGDSLFSTWIYRITVNTCIDEIRKYKRKNEVSIDDVVAQNLQVVDMTASILARDNKMPMWVFGLNEENSIVNTLKGKFNGTKVTV